MLDDIKNWRKIPTNTYKGILVEAKIRYAEMMSQSQNITDKLQKLIAVNSAIVIWNSKVVTDYAGRIPLWILIAISLFFIFSFGLIFFGFKSRKAVLIGSHPSETLHNERELSGIDEDGNYNEEEKEKVYYYLQCYSYKNRIDSFKPTLKARADIMDISALVTFFCFLISLVLFISLNF